MKKGALPANAVERLGIKKSGESYQTTQLDKTRKLMKEQEQESPVTETETTSKIKATWDSRNWGDDVDKNFPGAVYDVSRANLDNELDDMDLDQLDLELDRLEKKAKAGTLTEKDLRETELWKLDSVAYHAIAAQIEINPITAINGLRAGVNNPIAKDPVETKDVAPVTAIETAPVYTPEQQQEMKEYIDPVGTVKKELETATEPKLVASLKRNYRLLKDRLFPNITKMSEVSEAARQLDKRNIPYVYARFDIDNLTGVNDHFGQEGHEDADEALRAMLMDNVFQKIVDAGGIVGRDKGDELIAVIPGMTKAEADVMIEKGRQEALKIQKKLGLDKVYHSKKHLEGYGGGDFSYGVIDGIPGKYKETDKSADVIQRVMKEKKLHIYEKQGMLNNEETTDVKGKQLEKTGTKPQPTTVTGTKGTQKAVPSPSEGRSTGKPATKTDGTTKSLAPEFEQPQTVPIDIMESLYGPPEDNDQHQKAKDNVKA
ncbi:MAG TPA: GGDEF domain-containing protein, partial [Clostridia bacterium]|nr:GGDEF domain-containing protein [Clostridia bacterium]